MSVSNDEAAEKTASILQLLERYFDGLHHSNADLLADVFHPNAIYACATDGTLTHLNMDTYLPIVAAREAPAARHEARTDAVRSIDFVGPVTALTRVECSIGEKQFSDLLNLVHVDDRWQIIAKVFHYEIATKPTVQKGS